MSGWTPGPWKLVNLGDEALIVANGHSGEREVAIVARADSSGKRQARSLGMMSERECAEARLISAAPEMFEALCRIAEHESRADRRKTGMVDVSEMESLQRIARLAVAKAEGMASP